MGIYSTFTHQQRKVSYDFIENFIANNVPDWNQWNSVNDTDRIEALFSNAIQTMPQIEFEFLLLHSGYIPDQYGNDSSQETLYSKLIESLVCEWAKRIGFDGSLLQKQKSNKEDVTIIKGNNVIVCDAKSFRLGRSQAAPNVKDTIKKQAYQTWLEAYEESQRVGGLTTFPSMHDWKKGGEAYTYYSSDNPATMILFYEHMAYMLHYNKSADSIIQFLRNYATIFPSASSNKEHYWRTVKTHLFGNVEFILYMAEVKKYTEEKAQHSLRKIEYTIKEIEKQVLNDVSQMTYGALKKFAVEVTTHSRTKVLRDQAGHIRDFRPLPKANSEDG